MRTFSFSILLTLLIENRFQLGISAKYYEQQLTEQAHVLSITEAKADEEFWEDIPFDDFDEENYSDHESEQISADASERATKEEIDLMILQAKMDAR